MNKTHIKLALAVIGLIAALQCHADGVLNTVNQTTTIGGAPATGQGVTNNNSFALTLSNNVTVDAAHSIASAAITNSGNVQSATFNTSGAAAIGTTLLVGGATTIASPFKVTSLAVVRFPSSGVYNWNNFAENGTGLQFQFNGAPILDWVANGTTLASTNWIFKGTITATNGSASYARNLLAPIAITVGSSPFNWTNSSASAGGGTNNVTVFVDGVSVTGTVGVNGTTIFNTIGQCTVPLQPGEWTTITYTIGTPTATFKPH